MHPIAPKLSDLAKYYMSELFYDEQKSNLVMSLIQNSDDKRLKVLLEKEVKKRSAKAIDHLFLGHFYFELNELESAQNPLEKAILIDKNNTVILTFLGLIYLKKNMHQKSQDIFEKIVDLQENKNYDMNCFLAEFYNSTFQWRKAYNYIFDKCEVKDERLALANFYALDGLRRTSRAVRYISSFHKKNKQSQAGALALVNGNLKINRISDAVSILQEQFKKNPDNPQLIWNLVKNNAIDFDEEFIEKLSKQFLTTLTGSDNNSKPQLPYLGFSLAHIYKELDDAENEFNFLSSANDALWKLNPFDLSNHMSLTDRIMELGVTKSIYTDKKKINENRKIIFIVGMPRSGSTLLEAILNEVPEFYGAGELPFLEQSIISSNILENPTKEKFLEVNVKYHSFLESLEVVQPVILDKTPLNYRFIPIIKIAFPDSLIVNCTRDAKSNLFSCFENFWESPVLNFTCKQDVLNNYFDRYRALLKVYDLSFEGSIYHFSLNNLINNRVQELTNLFDHLNIPFKEKYLEFYKSTRSISSASMLQVRQPIFSKVSDRYKVHEKSLGFLFKDLA